MKPKTLYISFAILITVVIMSILIMRRNATIQLTSLGLKPQAQEEVIQQQDLLPTNTQQFSAPGNKPAIAIIKKPALENKTIPLAEQAENKLKDIQQSEKSSASSTQPPTAAEEELDATSGITKINKHPTAEEKKEMNARGIVIY